MPAPVAAGVRPVPAVVAVRDGVVVQVAVMRPQPQARRVVAVLVEVTALQVPYSPQQRMRQPWPMAQPVQCRSLSMRHRKAHCRPMSFRVSAQLKADASASIGLT